WVISYDCAVRDDAANNDRSRSDARIYVSPGWDRRGGCASFQTTLSQATQTPLGALPVSGEICLNADRRESRNQPAPVLLTPITPLKKTDMLVSVLIPVFNEVDTVAEIVDRVRETPYTKEIICVDDASTDGTRDVLARLLREGKIQQAIYQSRNQGKGAAVRAAIKASHGDIVIVQDADLEYSPADWPLMFEPLIQGRADAVFGSRFLGGTHRVLYYWHSVGNGVLTTLSNMFSNLNMTDMECCYKAVRGELARSLTLKSQRFGFEPEITARLAHANAGIFEVPVTYSGRTYMEGKKITWRDGMAALFHILRYNLFP